MPWYAFINKETNLLLSYYSHNLKNNYVEAFQDNQIKINSFSKYIEHYDSFEELRSKVYNQKIPFICYFNSKDERKFMNSKVIVKPDYLN